MRKAFIILTFLWSIVAVNAQSSLPAEISSADNSANTLTDLPLIPHNHKVDIFFNGEKPKEEYYRVRITEVSGSATYNELLNAIQQNAKQIGFDALMILGKDEYVRSDNSVGSAIIAGTIAGIAGDKDYRYHPSLITGQTLTAVGLKYKMNMQYVDTIVKTAYILLKDSINTKYELSFLMNGTFREKIFSSASDFYLRNISLFKKADVYATNNNFNTNQYPGSNNYSNIVSAKTETDSGVIKYAATFINESMLQKVDIRMPASVFFKSIKKYGILYAFDNGVISKRDIRQGRKDDPLYADIYTYDDKKRCTGFVRYLAKTNDEVFRVIYDFYSMNDLPAAEK
jgi:hypothetical protein